MKQGLLRLLSLPLLCSACTGKPADTVPDPADTSDTGDTGVRPQAGVVLRAGGGSEGEQEDMSAWSARLYPHLWDSGDVTGDGLVKLLKDEFNCLGPYSDAKPGQCGELQFLSASDASQLAAFRTPGLRNVAARPPYMHAGQFASLEQVVQHYAASPKAVLGHSELALPEDRHAERQPIRLSADEIKDLAVFLGTLTGPVHQPR